VVSTFFVLLVFGGYSLTLVGALRAHGLETVTRVVDGDTLHLANGEKVRLLGVDTPETKHPKKRRQPFGKEAGDFTRRLVEGRRVRVVRATQGDRYGRTLAYVYLSDGSLLNQEIIRHGLGRVYLGSAFERRQQFLSLEAEARRAKRGIWS
jgi:micrococcal nuclease